MTSHPLLDSRARLVIAHRGNRAWAPENTIAALRQAAELGADALEFDVRLSRDGVAVLIHDHTVDRTTDACGAVSSFSLDELQRMNAAAHAPRGWSGVEHIPSLEEALDSFRELPLVIEVKEMAAAEVTASLVRRFGAEGRVLIGSADPRVMQWFYRSGLRSCASMRDASRWIPLALVGRSPARPAFDVLSITRWFRGLPIPVARMAAVAHKVGVPTHVWTVNDPSIARRLWAAGVSGIVTDDPRAMIEARRD